MDVQERVDSHKQREVQREVQRGSESADRESSVRYTIAL
jgi:hypothetical protein